MSETCIIRRVRRTDVAALFALMGEMAEYERQLERFTATEDGLAAELFADAPLIHGVIAEQDSRPVGFATWTLSLTTFDCRRAMFVEDVFVTAARRGIGIGYMLFRHMAREAVAQGCARMDWHVLDWNEPALRFYARLGATPPAGGWMARQLTGDALAALAGASAP